MEKAQVQAQDELVRANQTEIKLKRFQGQVQVREESMESQMNELKQEV